MNDATTQAAMGGSPDFANNIVTLGAGITALIFIFGFLYLLLKEGVPALKTVAASIISAIEKMSETMDALNRTMVTQQEASIAAINSLERRVLSMEQRLGTHVETACRIESKVDTVGITAIEIKERVRNCTGIREPGARSRREDKQ